MKPILILICCVVFLQSFAFAHFYLNGNGDRMGVSQKKLENYITKAIEGFRKMMPKGDEELGYPVMDPYNIEDASWDYVDRSNTRKYRLNFFNKNDTILKGLSNFEIKMLKASAKDMGLTAQLTFKNLQTEFPYKLDGYMMKNFMPVYGEGIVKLIGPNVTMQISVNLGIEQSYIVVEENDVHLHPNNIEVRATGLMDLPDSFANLVLDDILETIVKRHGNAALTNFVHNLVEEAVGGMTTDEFFEYLDHFVKKTERQ